MREIENLLPHRDPFLYVDHLLSVTIEEIVGTKIFDFSELFSPNDAAADPCFVPGMILVESLAQCGGAGARKLQGTGSEGLFGLAGIESACFHAYVEFGKTVKMIVKNLKLGSKVVRQSGVAYVDDMPVAEATWTCVRFQ